MDIPEGEYWDRVLYAAHICLHARWISVEVQARYSRVAPEHINHAKVRILNGHDATTRFAEENG